MRFITLVAILVLGLQNLQTRCNQPAEISGMDHGVIVLTDDHSIPEATAARELSEYLHKATGGEFPIVSESEASPTGYRIYVGPTQFATDRNVPAADQLGPEEWIVRSFDDQQAVVIAGGRPRGTLYGAYRFLEDVVGVHWWNPWEESVPTVGQIDISDLDLRGQPAFEARDLFMIYGRDGGRFSARNRLNRQGDEPISGQYGGQFGYGPPYHVQTFHHYVPPAQYFDEHPEFYALVDGNRMKSLIQLCYTHQELRELMVEKLKTYITNAEAQARRDNTPTPTIYEISTNEWDKFCRCDSCKALADKEESNAGPLLDFINHLADAIKDDHPDIQIGTLVFLNSEKPPKNIRPRDNVSVRLWDTRRNLIKGLDAEDNRSFRQLILDWAKVTPNLRVWDYGVTIGLYPGFPKPILRNYPVTYQFLAETGVKGILTEIPGPIMADMRDLNVWVMIKLLEDPYADYDQLIKTFTESFYGSAGKLIQMYLTLLEQSAEKKPSYIGLRPTPLHHRYLDLAFVIKSQFLFEAAEKTVKDDEVLLRRVNHARMPLDRATAYLFSSLKSEWVEQGRDPEKFPLERQTILDRYRQTWIEQVKLRMPDAIAAGGRTEADAEIERILAAPEYIVPPSKFTDMPRWKIFDFPAYTARNFKYIAVVVEDQDAETGQTIRLEFPTKVDPEQNPVEKFHLPMIWGLYDQSGGLKDRTGLIEPDDVPGPGYHWYKMGDFTIVPSDYAFLFWNWIIQFDIGSVPLPNKDQTFELWSRIKFEGPAFPHGKADESNAISVERLVIIDVTPESKEQKD